MKIRPVFNKCTIFLRLKTFSITTSLIISLIFTVSSINCIAQAPAVSQQVKEIMPGILQGYLSRAELPNSLALIPPPPAEGSAAFALDQECAKKAVASTDTARKAQAVQDADLSFPNAARAFESTIGIEISEAKTPKLYMLLRRVLTDAGLATYSAKNQYNRKRPFMVNYTPTLTPDQDAALRKDGSYPSGHTSIGWAWALVLCEIFPEKMNAILQRGYAFGESRVLCNVHWHSDVEMGRVVGAAAVASLHANKAFQEDLAAVKEEIKNYKP